MKNSEVRGVRVGMRRDVETAQEDKARKPLKTYKNKNELQTCSKPMLRGSSLVGQVGGGARTSWIWTAPIFCETADVEDSVAADDDAADDDDVDADTAAAAAAAAADAAAVDDGAATTRQSCALNASLAGAAGGPR
jgi:hypothetical protein